MIGEHAAPHHMHGAVEMLKSKAPHAFGRWAARRPGCLLAYAASGTHVQLFAVDRGHEVRIIKMTPAWVVGIADACDVLAVVLRWLRGACIMAANSRTDNTESKKSAVPQCPCLIMNHAIDTSPRQLLCSCTLPAKQWTSRRFRAAGRWWRHLPRATAFWRLQQQPWTRRMPATLNND